MISEITLAVSSCEPCIDHLHILIFIQIFMMLTIWRDEHERGSPQSFTQRLKACLVLVTIYLC